MPIGRQYNINRIEKLPRVILVALSFLYPDFINAKFTSEALYEENKYGQDLERFINIINNGNELKYFKEEDHLIYKYLVPIDGNGAA